MEFKDSKTYQNLEAAFAGESKARNKYSYYASKARKEGFNQIADFFEETAHNEKEHAKIWFKLLFSGIASTQENLKDAVRGESYENEVMYKQFAQEAQAEGFADIAKLFDKVGEIENTHKEGYQRLLTQLESSSLFSKNEQVIWICSNCGYSLSSKDAPEECPVCEHPRAYFKVMKGNV